MTAVVLPFRAVGGDRQTDAGPEKATVAPDPTCGKVLNRFSTALQGNENRSSSALILDYPRVPGTGH